MFDIFLYSSLFFWSLFILCGWHAIGNWELSTPKNDNILPAPPPSSCRLVIKISPHHLILLRSRTSSSYQCFRWPTTPDILTFSNVSDNLSIYFDKWYFLHWHGTSLWTTDVLAFGMCMIFSLKFEYSIGEVMTIKMENQFDFLLSILANKCIWYCFLLFWKCLQYKHHHLWWHNST